MNIFVDFKEGESLQSRPSLTSHIILVTVGLDNTSVALLLEILHVERLVSVELLVVFSRDVPASTK